MTVMPRDHEWTVADLANTPDDGLRYELVDGVLLMSAAPSNVHQIVLGELYMVLRAACPADARVMLAPTDYQPTRRRSLQPDLLEARRTDVGSDPISAPLLLAVEVLSPSTRSVDLLLKRGSTPRAASRRTGSSIRVNPRSRPGRSSTGTGSMPAVPSVTRCSPSSSPSRCGCSRPRSWTRRQTGKPFAVGPMPGQDAGGADPPPRP